MLYAESRLGSLIAIGKGDVPEEHWFRMARTLPPACGWQGQRSRSDAARETVGEHEFYGGWYTWQGERFVPSWGGSMFEALMPTLVLDEARLAPASLGANGAAHATVQRRWALETLGYPVWGLSPSMMPARASTASSGPSARRPRVRGGAVTPHASALVLPPRPAGRRREPPPARRPYPMYGEFGFYDAVDPRPARSPRATWRSTSR